MYTALSYVITMFQTLYGHVNTNAYIMSRCGQSSNELNIQLSLSKFSSTKKRYEHLFNLTGMNKNYRSFKTVSIELFVL